MPHHPRRPQRRPGCVSQPELHTSSAAWLEGVLSMFEAEGLDVPSLLRDAGFDPDSLHRQNARIPVDEITVLWQLAVARAGGPRWACTATSPPPTASWARWATPWPAAPTWARRSRGWRATWP
jgi:hypothetical protein